MTHAGYYQANSERCKALWQAWYHSPKGKQRHLKQKYNFTLEQYNEMLQRQGGHCVFCSETKLDVDHCHQTGRFRGLLCRKHNTAIGYLEWLPDAEIQKIREYLAQCS